jgi:hypothetical protein
LLRKLDTTARESGIDAVHHEREALEVGERHDRLVLYCMHTQLILVRAYNYLIRGRIHQKESWPSLGWPAE